MIGSMHNTRAIQSQHLHPDTTSNSLDTTNPNTECILSCVLAVRPSADLATRYTQLNGFFREMAAPHMLTETGHLLANCSRANPGTAPLPLVPQFSSQRDLTRASESDVTWINLTWQLPDFYNLGECKIVPISESQQSMLANTLIKHINGTDKDPESQATHAHLANSLRDAIKTAPSEGAPPPNANQTTENLLIINAQAPVDSVSLHYTLPATSNTAASFEQAQPVKEYVHCRVFPLNPALATNSPNGEAEQFPFVGVPIVSYDLCGRYSDPDPIEAQLISAAAQQSHAT